MNKNVAIIVGIGAGIYTAFNIFQLGYRKWSASSAPDPILNNDVDKLTQDLNNLALAPEPAPKLTQEPMPSSSTTLLPEADDIDDVELNLYEIIACYSEYACSDARQYPTIIPEDSKDKIFNLYKNIPEHLKTLESRANISAANPIGGRYQPYTIKKISIDIDKCKSACCTTFAISAAHKIMEQYPEYRVEIVTTKGHCFVLVNRKYIEDEELDFTSTPDTWGNQTIICDPWLSSLQYRGIYTHRDEDELYPFINAKSRLQRKFDSLSLKASPEAEASTSSYRHSPR